LDLVLVFQDLDSSVFWTLDGLICINQLLTQK
jgi:hypothetical protein